MGISTARHLIVSASFLGAVVANAGCSKDEFDDRSTLVTVGGSTTAYELDSCGLDGQTVFVVGRAADGAILQGVMGLDSDDTTGITESTGATIDLDPTSDDSRVAAFGAESWERRGSVGPPPGTISAARLRGSRIQFSGEAVPVDADDVAVPGGEERRFSVDARCDEVEQD